MATIYIDSTSHEVDPAKNLLEVCLSLGYDLPYFCWHPAMGSVGACRQCAVKQFKDENDQKGKLVMACMTPASDGTRISIRDKEAAHFRQTIIEWLMVNHPHDCPICDEGGECHLQDMTVMTGHNYRQFRFNKRTHRNQYLGPFVNHEMNRCIECYRCVRFYQDFAGGDDLDVFGAHDHVYFGRHEDGVLESEFSGNLVEVCPTGVFTDKTLKKHYTRKWDLTTAPSVCVNCAVGCNTLPGERYGQLRRIRNRYNPEVNGYFICDRGRYGYEFVNSPQRLRTPEVDHHPATRLEAIRETATRAGTRILGIGSPRASIEANYALRAWVGPENFYQGMSTTQSRLVDFARRTLTEGPARSPSLQDIAHADAILILGEDLTNTAPMMAYAVRQAVRNRPIENLPEQAQIPLWNEAAVREAMQDETGPFFVATSLETKLNPLATRIFIGASEDIAALGFAVARALDASAPQIPDFPASRQALADEIAQALQNAERPLIISGTSLGSEAVMKAAANVAWALKGRAELSFVVPEANSMGVSLLGGGSLEEAAKAAEQGVDTLIVLENDLYRRAPAGMVEKLFEAAKNVIVLDTLTNGTPPRADIILPTATFAEGDGTFVNNEGRAQRFFQVYETPFEDEIFEAWRWIRAIMCAAGREVKWENLDELQAEIAATLPIFARLPETTPPTSFRIHGQKVPREAARFSGRTSMLANVQISEPKPPNDPDSPMSFTMEGVKNVAPPGSLLPRYWWPGWNSVQALNKFQEEIAGPLREGNPGIRLLEPGTTNGTPYFDWEEAPKKQEGWQVIPLYHIFGSEELSFHTPGIAERAPAPYIALSSQDAKALRRANGDMLELRTTNGTFSLPVQVIASLPKQTVGLPIGLHGMPFVDGEPVEVKA